MEPVHRHCRVALQVRLKVLGDITSKPDKAELTPTNRCFGMAWKGMIPAKRVREAARGNKLGKQSLRSGRTSAWGVANAWLKILWSLMGAYKASHQTEAESCRYLLPSLASRSIIELLYPRPKTSTKGLQSSRVILNRGSKAWGYPLCVVWNFTARGG